jgi:hypothetical protein
MAWTNKNRRVAHIAAGMMPVTLIVQVRLSDYLGIPVPAFRRE